MRYRADRHRTYAPSNTLAFETDCDLAPHLPRYIDSYINRRLHSALGYLSSARFEEEWSHKLVKAAAKGLPAPGTHSVG